MKINCVRISIMKRRKTFTESQTRGFYNSNKKMLGLVDVDHASRVCGMYEDIGHC